MTPRLAVAVAAATSSAPAASATLRLSVEYDGSAFAGYQWQPTARTVAGVLEEALTRLLREPVKITGAGRTDAGVHATGQVISFATSRSFPFERLGVALASHLPPDLGVRDVAVVGDEFSARFSAIERSYVYAIRVARAPSALLARRAYHVWRPLELEPMRAAAAHLLGTHDFRSFCGVPPENGNTVRTVRSLELERRDELICVRIRANAFVHRMVRTIVGTLVECGRGRRDPAAMPAILAARDRAAAGACAPAHGLYLAGVRYPDFNSHRDPPLFG